MKGLSRNLTKSELTLLAILIVLILGAAYFYLVDQPVRAGIAAAEAKEAALIPEVDEVNARLAEINNMENELAEMEANGHGLSYMPSYNASKAELDFLNNVLAQAEDYIISFSDVSREGDQIRRAFSLQYTARDYDEAIAIIKAMEECENRCLVGNFTVNPVQGEDILTEEVTVACNAIFYETAYEAVVDKDLPPDTGSETAQ